MKRYNECWYKGECCVQEVDQNAVIRGTESFTDEEPWFWFHMVVGISMCGSLYMLYLLIDTVTHLKSVVSNGF